MKYREEYKVHVIGKTGLSCTYIIEGIYGYAAVDVGSTGAATDVEAYIVGELGESLSRLEFIVSTHFHIDHIGGIGKLLQRCDGKTKVLFNYRVERYLSGKEAPVLIKNWFPGFIPATLGSVKNIRRTSHLCFPLLAGIPVPVLRKRMKMPFSRDRIVFVGTGASQRYRLGFEDWEVIETPGHTKDSISFYRESTRELICGDFILNTGRRGQGILNRFCWSRKEMRRSYNSLREMIEAEIIYPGHGKVIRGSADVLRNVDIF